MTIIYDTLWQIVIFSVRAKENLWQYGRIEKTRHPQMNNGLNLIVKYFL